MDVCSFLFWKDLFADNELVAFSFKARRSEEHRSGGNGSNCEARGEPMKTRPVKKSSSSSSSPLVLSLLFSSSSLFSESDSGGRPDKDRYLAERIAIASIASPMISSSSSSSLFCPHRCYCWLVRKAVRGLLLPDRVEGKWRRR